MRTVTRNVLIGIALVVVLLLALGALPGYLKSGSPYYVVATPVDSPPVATDGGNGTDRGNATGSGNATDGPANATGGPANATITSYNASQLPANRYRYTMAALGNATAGSPGRSHPYWRGPVGFKGAFTHSPFEEIDGIAGRAPNATDGDAVFVRHEETTFRLAIEREDRQ